MPKNWWFKFDFRVWRTASDLRLCSMETRGFWLEVLCAMHESEQSKLSGSFEEIARLIGCDTTVASRCILELKRTKTADILIGNGVVKISSRRMKRELTERKQTRLRVERHRSSNGDSNGQETPQSKSNDEESSSKEKKTTTATTRPKLSDDEWLESLRVNPTYQRIDVLNEYARAGIWADANNRQRTRKFFVNWLNRARPMEVKEVKTNGTNQQHQSNGRRSSSLERIADHADIISQYPTEAELRDKS